MTNLLYGVGSVKTRDTISRNAERDNVTIRVRETTVAPQAVRTCLGQGQRRYA